jgi:hypothetical protein
MAVTGIFSLELIWLKIHSEKEGREEMTTWLSGFLSGVIATIIGFLLTMLWDIYKYRRDSGKRDKSVLNSIREELISNKSIVLKNQQMLQQEMDLLSKNIMVGSPLSTLQGGFWDLVKINLPNQFIKGNSLISVRKIALLTDEINEIIRNRENYKLFNGFASDYSNRLRSYDQLLYLHCLEIVKLFEIIQNEEWFDKLY